MKALRVRSGWALVAVIACGGGAGVAPNPTAPLSSATPTVTPTSSTGALSASASAPKPAFAGPMKPIAASSMVADAAAIGIDLKNPPQLSKLEPDKLRKVMKLFTKALGAQCSDCHADDMAAPTPKKKVAEKMWNEFVVKLTMADGSPIFCDTCHQGRTLQLDRHDKKVVSEWMDENLTSKLKRRDKKEHDCGTCHGDPPEYLFLAEWRK